MVKLKIQSAQDIVEAYISCLGLKKNDAQVLLDAYPKLSKSNNLIASLNEIVYLKAKEIYKTKLAKTQLTALYKAAFIDLEIAKKYGVKPLLPNFADTDFTELMHKAYIETAPSYKLTEMPTQEIDPIHLHKAKKAKGEKK